MLAALWRKALQAEIESQGEDPKAGAFSTCIKNIEEDNVATKNQQEEIIRS